MSARHISPDLDLLITVHYGKFPVCLTTIFTKKCLKIPKR